MHIQQLDKQTYKVTISLGTNPFTGKRERIYQRIKARSKTEAKLKAQELEVNIKLKNKINVSSANLNQLIQRWLHVDGDNLSPSTLYKHKCCIRKNIEPTIGKMEIKKITTTILNNFYQSLIDSGLSPKSVRNIHGILRRAFNFGLGEGICYKNPAINTTLPKSEKNNLQIPTKAQMIKILEHVANNEELELYLIISVMCGLRRGEVCGLKWKDINFEKKEITIERSVVDIGGYRVIKGTKTGTIRKISLPNLCITKLQQWLQIIQTASKIVNQKIDDNSFIFSPDYDGARPYIPDRWSKQFLRIKKNLGLDNIRLHDLRHFMATQLISAGVDIRTVSGRLGHAQTSTTLNIYSHFLEAKDEEASLIMDDIIG